jgi:hypothetical protein
MAHLVSSHTIATQFYRCPERLSNRLTSYFSMI